jgi:hypothetical protein
MRNFRGTRGRWEVQGYNQVVNMYCTIADCENWQLDKTGVEQQHNALLISKAPEMLEMLEKFVSLNPQSSIQISDLMDEAEKLIKKATEL